MKPETKYYRLLEMIPGALIWTTLLLSVIVSFWQPLWVIFFIIAFDLFWLFRIAHFIFFVSLSFFKYKQVVQVNWFEKVKQIDNWERLFHIIYLPTAGEPVEVLRSTFRSLLNSEYPAQKMIVVLGGEGRMENDFLPKAEAIKREFTSKFFRVFITLHPGDLPDEMKGKGANANWMGHESKKKIDELNIPYEDLIVSYFDSDTCVHPQYFSYLTYKYLTHPTPMRVSYQPAV